MENQIMSEFTNDDVELLDYPQVAEPSTENHLSTRTPYSAIEISVIDSLSGNPIPHALISFDSLLQTGRCDSNGFFHLNNIPHGKIPVDVIMPGYIACSVVAECTAASHKIQIMMDRSRQLL